MAAVIFLPNRMAGRVLLWLCPGTRPSVVLRGCKAEVSAGCPYSDLHVRSGGREYIFRRYAIFRPGRRGVLNRGSPTTVKRAEGHTDSQWEYTSAFLHALTSHLRSHLRSITGRGAPWEGERERPFRETWERDCWCGRALKIRSYRISSEHSLLQVADARACFERRRRLDV